MAERQCYLKDWRWHRKGLAVFGTLFIQLLVQLLNSSMVRFNTVKPVLLLLQTERLHHYDTELCFPETPPQLRGKAMWSKIKPLFIWKPFSSLLTEVFESFHRDALVNQTDSYNGKMTYRPTVEADQGVELMLLSFAWPQWYWASHLSLSSLWLDLEDTLHCGSKRGQPRKNDRPLS